MTWSAPPWSCSRARAPYQGLPVAAPDASIFGPLHSNYPPTAYLLTGVLTLVGAPARDYLWIGFNELLLLATLVALYAGIGRPKAIEVVLVLTLALFTLPFSHNTYWGQINLFVLLMIVLAVLANQRGRPWLGGVALAAGIAIKVTPLALLPYFAWRRNWRLLAATALILVLLVGVTLALGWGPRWPEYFDFIGSSGRGTGFIDNQSLNGLLLRLWRPELSGYPIGPLPPAFLVVWYAADLVVLGFVVLALRGPRLSQPLKTWTEVAMILLVLPVLQPIAWFHHYVFALVAFVIAVRLARLRALPPLSIGGLALAYLLAAPVAALIEAPALATGGLRLAQFPVLRFGSSVTVVAALIAIGSLSRARLLQSRPSRRVADQLVDSSPS